MTKIFKTPITASSGTNTFGVTNFSSSVTVNDLTINSSSAAGATFTISQGTAPTSPANGDVWTTSAGLYVRINGSTVGPLSASGSGPASTVTTLYGSVTGAGTVGASITYAREDHTHTLSGFVNSSTNETIGGVKTFSGSLIASTASISGSITATAGTVGNWTVSSSGISSGVITSGSATFNNLVTLASSSASSPFTITPGAAVTTNNTNGDVWTTSAGMYVRINGATESLLFDPGAWTAWTPALTSTASNPSIGSTGHIADGYYTQVGNIMFFNLRLQFGTTGVSFGSGGYIVSLPVAPLRSYIRCEGFLIENSPTTRYLIHGMTNGGATTMALYTQTGTPGVLTNVTPSNPAILAVSDSIHVSGSYEVA